MAQIEKRGDGYRITVFKGRKPDGTRILERTTWHPDPNKTEKQNQNDLQRYALNYEAKVKAGEILDGEKLKVSDYAAIWLRDEIKTTREQNTYVQYEHLLNRHILPEIGNLHLTEVKPKHIKDMLVALSRTRKDGKDGGYSRKTLKHCKEVCSSLFTSAINDGLIKENPCDHVALPKTQVDEKPVEEKYFTMEQTIIFLDFINKDFLSHHKEHDRQMNGQSYHVAEYTETHSVPTQLRLFFNLAIYGGFRRGELVGLKWEDIDFQNNTILIRRSTVQIKGQPVTKEPKSRASKRLVALPPEIMQMFKEYKKEQLEYRLACGSFWTGDGTNVFIQRDGQQIFPDTPTKAFKKIINRYNAEHPENPLPETTLHGLRHTSASLAIRTGTDVKTISKRLGHAQTSTTLDLYAYFFKEADKEVATAISSLLKPSMGD